AGTGAQVIRRNASEFIGITPISTEIPSAFSLSQNYPNPFNPSTVIRFGIPNGIPSLEGSAQRGVGMVTLKVYNINGREVLTLVNESLAPGTYETTFDGSNYPSGAYFYKLTSGSFSQTKKLTLLK
ncbi:MAG: T9SS type A sorting domain-containing protein, partial [Ignavibacteria bacterium]